MSYPNPLGLPDEILGIVQNSITVEYASLRRDGTPITFPIAPFVGDDGCTLDVQTGLAYTAKAQRARHNPKVCLLYSEPRGSGIENPPVVLVYGQATVRDADLQANTDRYVRLGAQRYAEAYSRFPGFMMKRMGWYFARIFVQVTPLRILWWPGGKMDQEAKTWTAPEGTQAPPSDPPPHGKALKPWDTPPTDWRAGAKEAVQSLGRPILTVRDADGFPVPFRVREVSLDQDGFGLSLFPTMPAAARGRACLTFHIHNEIFTWNNNMAFIGDVTGDKDSAQFKVKRQLASVSVSPNQVKLMWTMFNLWRRFAPRIKREAERRGQPVPTIHPPS